VKSRAHKVEEQRTEGKKQRAEIRENSPYLLLVPLGLDPLDRHIGLRETTCVYKFRAIVVLLCLLTASLFRNIIRYDCANVTYFGLRGN
jgi:hypothetical protein